jgi:hypothetical protein|nr:hypothetical protein [Kofleriaceae bacterium]
MRGAIAVVVIGAALAAASACGKKASFPYSNPPPEDAHASCGLTTCSSIGATCGFIGDGCSDTVDCGDCGSGSICGGDGTLFQCGSDSACKPRTCGELGAECGRVADGCGALSDDCGTCPTGTACGAAGIANHCDPTPCTGLCTQQAACGAQPKTSITGRVTAPGHDDTATWGTPDPIFGALVFVPNGAAGAPTYGTEAFTSGVSCDTCSSVVTGSPLVQAVTGVDGTFTLQNAPCGTDIPLVMQLGRWRRQITIPAVACCATTALTAAQTHLPRTRVGEPGDVRSDIPRMAFSTGGVDTLHCVLRKMGIDDSEFTNPSGVGRVVFYQDSGAKLNATTPPASTLYASKAELAKYDMTLFECVGAEEDKTAGEQANVISYANTGGRVFATHFSYVWLTNDGSAGANTGPRPFSQTATWDVNQSEADTATGFVDTTLQGDPDTQARRVAFAQWLQLTGASPTAGQIPVTAVRQDVDAISSVAATASGAPAQRWLYASGSPFSAPLTYTFDTPIAYPPAAKPAAQCGRVMFSDFHVSDGSAYDSTFPSECDDGPMTPQERTLEFMLFDLATCTGPQPSACVPKTCADFGYTCGLSGDGCDDGEVLDCGGCENGRTCGAGGYGQCGTGLCVPQTCADVGAQCGPIGDGCGGTVDCGPCAGNAECGGGGSANVCGPVLK